MKHIAIDEQDERVKEFVRTLSQESEDIEIELEGRVICKVIAPNQLSESEKEMILDRGWELVQRAGSRNKGTSAKTIEREVQQAVQEVRARKQSR